MESNYSTMNMVMKKPTSVSMEILGHNRVKVLVFPSPTSYMLTSVRVSLLTQGIFYKPLLNDLLFFLNPWNLNRLFFELNRFIVTT